MLRLRKLLGIIFIFGIVFFIICDEKGYKFGFEEGQIVLDNDGRKIEILNIEGKEKNKEVPQNSVIYKNSNVIHINSEFKNPKNLRKSVGINSEYLAKIEEEKKLEEEKLKYKGPNILSLDDSDTISNVFQGLENQNNTGVNEFEIKETTGINNQEFNQETGTTKIEESSSKDNLSNSKDTEIEGLYKNSNRIQLYSGFANPRNMRRSTGVEENFSAKQESKKSIIIPLNDSGMVSSTWQDKNENNTGNSEENNTVSEEKTTYEIEKYQPKTYNLNLRTGVVIKHDSVAENNGVIAENNEIITETNQPIEEKITYKIEKYQPKTYKLNLKKGVIIEHNFVVENNETTETTETTETWLSDSMLKSLLENEEINIDTLESENDEFLQKVFEKTRDTNVMNLIVETYLNEYQFVKAKKFIEKLPEEYLSKLKPSLNLRVAFNSFALSSKNINENLKIIVQDYSSNGFIFDEDKNRYLGVIELMNRNYDKFFEISAGFTSEKNKAFASKLQGYRDQISKQMGMPEYYFDTLVSLELFNQGLFQPAKVLALYSLQQNTKYILPYQILAYANFLTNSWDTSIEYLKKLEDIDSNNAEKYRFLMGVAYYRDNKYEQSVVMLSMVKDEKLRLDAQRYLINDYLKLDQKNKLISNRNKLLGYENLVASDFYTYFYETFFHPYSKGEEFQLYAFDTELANKMLRACSTILQDEEKAVCTYGTIGRNIALGQFDGLEQYLLNLVAEYPQGYLYQAIGDYYLQHLEFEKAKAYLLKAVSLTQERSELVQIKKLLKDAI